MDACSTDTLTVDEITGFKIGFSPTSYPASVTAFFIALRLVTLSSKSTVAPLFSRLTSTDLTPFTLEMASVTLLCQCIHVIPKIPIVTFITDYLPMLHIRLQQWLPLWHQR